MNKKKLLILLSIIVIVFIVLFLYKRNEVATISVTSNNNTNNVDIKVGNILTYSLLKDEYQFKIINITKNKISFEVNKYGLTDTSSLRSKDKKFIIYKGKKLKLHTQTTDY